MASHPTVGDLKQDALCPQCKGYLKDPVLMECGHNFCRDCISSYYQKWNKKSTPVQCPVCSKPLKDGKLRPNEQLGNIIEKLKHLPPTLGKDYLCPKHKKKMDLFCAEDVEPVCFLCKHSPEHKLHTLLPPEDVAEQYKSVCASVVRLGAFKGPCLLNTLLFVKRNKPGREKHLTSERGKKPQKDSRVGQQEVKQMLAKSQLILRDQCSSDHRPLCLYLSECPQPARWQADNLLEIQGSICKIWGSSAHGLPLNTASGKLFVADVTLKPETAHPQLVISKDCKSVRMGEVYRSLPRNPERFDEWPFVLGAEGFVSGRHFWEVAVAREDAWGVGVARMSVARAGDIDFSPEQGFWAVGKWEGNYTAYNPPFYTALTLHRVPKRIRVSLNCDGGWVTFFDADTALPVFTYSASFSGETIFPFFYVHGSARLRKGLPPHFGVAPGGRDPPFMWPSLSRPELQGWEQCDTGCS
uniref:Uncharacterized protein n=1 Tax=Varanus komodoensis TaxID=61221 RepID=A0A8D2J6C8_VARKO